MRPIIVALAVICAALRAIAEGALPVSSGLPVLTNIHQLEVATNLDLVEPTLWPVNLQGTALLGNSIQIITLDGSDKLYPVPMKEGARPLRRGDRLVLEGNGVADQTDLHFDLRPLVDNDNTHSMAPKTGGAFLKAGKHSLRVTYFDCGGDYGLQVFMEGPDWPRRELSGASLSHAEVDSVSGITRWSQGLVCRSFAGKWTRLPDFENLVPGRTGIVTNFNLDLLYTNNGALEFTGFIEVPREGHYTFTTVSDDGSALFLDASPCTVRVIGNTNLPPWPRFAAGQIPPNDTEAQFAEVEGVVTFISEEQSGLNLELTSGNGRTWVRVEKPIGLRPALLQGSRIRAVGVCRSALTPEGHRVAGSLEVPTANEITLVDVPHAVWMAHPVQPISQVLSLVSSNALPAFVHVGGTLSVEKEGELLRLEDETGSISIEWTQVPGDLVGQQAEVMGNCERADGEHTDASGLILRKCAFRRTVPGIGKNVQLPLLRTVREVKDLSRDEAQRGYPASIRGVVTFVWGMSGCFLQDGTWSIDVRIPDGVIQSPPKIGEYWQIDGVTFVEFAPDVLARRAEKLGSALMPEPIHPTWDQLVNGSLDTLYVEVQGVVSSTQSNTLSLLTRGGYIKVQVPDIDLDRLNGHDGALIRLRGCLIPARELLTQRVIFGEFGLRNASLAVDVPAPADPFVLPQKRISDLLLFDSHSSVLQRARLAGQYLQRSGGEFYLNDGESGLRISPQTGPELKRGDWVEVVGFPDLGSAASPVLREALVRKTGRGTLPEPRMLSPDNLLNGKYDSSLVRVETRLVGVRANARERILELQTGTRAFIARLPAGEAGEMQIPSGSRLSITGVYVGLGGDRAGGREIDSFQILLDSSKDIVILGRPSWWTPQRTWGAATVGLGALLLAGIWIWELRRRVESRTRELKNEIEGHKRTELRLEEQRELLSQEVERRKQIELEMERSHKQLVVASRIAGMAEVATGILHNVGNVLTSVNVLCSSLSERIRGSKMSSVAKLSDILGQNSARLAEFLAQDERGKRLPVYIQQLGSHLIQEQSALLGQVKTLNENIIHINQIVATQQTYARNTDAIETVSPEEIVEDAIRMHGEALMRHKIKLLRDYSQVSPALLDRHKVLQILFNLFENAKHACDQQSPAEKQVVVSVGLANNPGMIQISVADNGVGIPLENLSRIFAQGFSTRKDGHGFGLHSSILAAQSMKGRLSARSEGRGQGACFTLELPVAPVKRI